MKNVVLLIGLLMASCASNKSVLLPVEMDAYAKINSYLRMPLFEKGGSYEFARAEGCKFSIVKNWDPIIAERKGYYSVRTEVVIDAIDPSVRAYYDNGEVIYNEKTGKTETWSPTIRIFVGENANAKIIRTRLRGDEPTIKKYYPKGLSLGGLDPDRDAISKDFITTLNAMIWECRKGDT
ncbi:hypothetical protein SAMN02745866_04085 [Alteromonadaceae bacterium Bs31]|nr:hypothetical protein SAMN02745866_04085 [Alteromonadaceae bacterium Bs31]